MVIALVLKSPEKLYLFQLAFAEIQARPLLFFEIIASNVSTVCFESSDRRTYRVFKRIYLILNLILIKFYYL